MPNFGNWPTKATPVGADKVVGTDSVDGQFKNFTLGSLDVTTVVSKTANYTVGVLEGISLFDTTAGNIAVTLPAAAGALGREYIIKRTSAGANTLTITPASGTIDGAANTTISAQWGVVRLFSDGTNWFTY